MPFLVECLNSICKQTETEWELIAIDDCSTDLSFQLLQSFARKDKRIKCFKNRGNGIIEALQMAFEKSEGTYIHRMDADDIMPLNKLETLKKVLQKDECNTVATAHVSYFAQNGVKEGYRLYAKWLNQLCNANNHWQDIYKECVVASPNWLIRKSELEKINAFQSNVYPEDYDLIFRFYERNYSIASTNVVTHHWRDHEKRSSRTMEVYKNNDYFELKWHYFKKIDLQENRPLMIWGAGPKGKKLAKVIQKDKIDFQWVSNNPNKHGKEIYHQILASFEQILQTENPQILIAVGKRGAQKKIQSFLHNQGHKQGKDYFFFC